MKRPLLLTAAILCGCSQNPTPTPPSGMPAQPPPPPPRVSAEWVGDLPGAHMFIITDSVEGGQYLAVMRHDHRASVAIQPLIKKP